MTSARRKAFKPRVWVEKMWHAPSFNCGGRVVCRTSLVWRGAAPGGPDIDLGPVGRYSLAETIERYKAVLQQKRLYAEMVCEQLRCLDKAA